MPTGACSWDSVSTRAGLHHCSIRAGIQVFLLYTVLSIVGNLFINIYIYIHNINDRQHNIQDL